MVFTLSPSTIGSGPADIDAQVLALVPAAEVERHPGDALADALRHQRLQRALALFSAP